MRRRRVLGLLAGGVAGMSSGCTGVLDGQTTPDPSPTPTPEPTPLPEPDHDGWPMAGYDAGKTGHHRTASLPETEPTRQWSYSREFDDDHGPSKLRVSAPAVHDGLVFVTEGGEPGYQPGEFELLAFDATTGEREWGHEIGQERFPTRRPAVGGDTVFVFAEAGGQYRGAVEAVAVADGERRWRQEFDQGPGALTVAGDTLFTTADGAVVALATDTGEQHWRADVQAAWAPLAIAERTVHVGCRDDTIRALDLGTGEVRWHYAVEDEIQTWPSVRDGFVYAGSSDRLVALQDGKEVWSFEPEHGVRTSGVAVDDEQVYVGGRELYALDATTGTEQWTQEWRWDTNLTRPPVVADGTVVITPYGWLACDATDGTIRWKLDRPVNSSQPAIADGVVYLADIDTVYAFAEDPEG